ncbi:MULTISPECIES: AraC family transcriptional regulator [unclassified Mycolicibacterium]|uniref:AraC family transcriptional regulator n=2 Tax=Mycolicibacterium TaxID=1866885 RepID=UPI002815ABF9|nr:MULTISPECIES: AraC family transcriptional regulator [unclassified Mycolicibacterium]
MVDWDIPRTPASIGVLLALASERGVGPETCLSGSRLTVVGLQSPSAEVTARQELTVVTNLLEALEYPDDLGVDVGLRYRLATYGIFGFALISSPTLRSAIDVGVRYLDLTFAASSLGTRTNDQEFHFVLEAAPGIPDRVRRFEIDRLATAIGVIKRELSADLPPFGVQFTHPRPANLDSYVAAFGIEPEFDAPENLLTLPVGLLDLPLPQANEYNSAATQEQCRNLLEERRSRTGLSGQVRDLLLASPSQPPTADEIAHAVGMSPRTLRHRLGTEGTSYRELLDEIRQRLAEEMLIKGRLTVAETASRLGYVELSSFSQAFRRWHGMGPRAFRASRT